MVPLRLPGGSVLQVFDSVEAELLAGEVDRYFFPELTLPADPMILDVGANVGVFSARCQERTGGAMRGHAFEPMPAVFQVLQANLHAVGSKLRAHSFGLGRHDAEADFAFFPRMPALSSQFRGLAQRDLDSERRRLVRLAVEMVQSGQLLPLLSGLPEPVLTGLVEGQMAGTLQPEVVRAKIRPLSAIIDEERIGRVDLLKIDVEGAELEVLAGINEGHWPQIRNLVLECELFATRAPELTRALEGRGYQVSLDQRPFEVEGDVGLIFATRLG